MSEQMEEVMCYECVVVPSVINPNEFNRYEINGLVIRIDAPSWSQASQAAKDRARRRGIKQPIAMDREAFELMLRQRSRATTPEEHQAAVRFRQEILEAYQSPMPDLNGSRDQWWRHSGGLANNDFKIGEIDVN